MRAMDNLPPSVPLTPPKEKKGCGCFGTGCIVVLVLMLIGGGIGFYAGYRIFEYVKSFTSEKGIEIAVIDGTDEEFSAVKAKIDAYEKAYDAGQAAAMQLTAREINILIARDPELKDWRGRVVVSIKDGKMGASLSVPIEKIPLVNAVPQFKERYFNGDVSGRFKVEEGKVTLTMDELKAGSQVASPALLQQLSEGWSQEVNSDPESKESLSRAKRIEVEGDVLIIEVNPSSTATEPPPAASTPEAPVESPSGS